MTTNSTTISDEIELTAFGYTLRVSTLGASLRGLWKLASTGVSEIIRSYSGTANKTGGQGDVLIPFPGRIRQGSYEFEGQRYQLECNDKDGPNAIHGFLRAMTWEIAQQSDAEIEFTVDLPQTAHSGYPFALRTDVNYGLSPQGLTCRFTITNMGDRLAPAAAGFHPYFMADIGPIDDWWLELPYSGVLEFVDLIPTGKILPVESKELDFRAGRTISGAVFNSCFTHPERSEDGLTHIRLQSANPSGVSIDVWADRALEYVVVYSGDPLPEGIRRRSLAIEPMTCAADGFNHPEWGLISLAPGETTSGSWGVSATTL